MGSVRRSNWRQYLAYLLLNVVVSAITVILMLSVWDRRERQSPGTPTPTIDIVALVASKVPTVTPTVTPSPTPVSYMVRSGDTLSDIAEMFGVPIETLMAANDLDDPDSLSAGQILIIPVEDLPEGGIPSPIERPTQTQETVTPPPTLVSPSVVISGVEGVGSINTETVRLHNEGGEVSMAGWTLDDGEGTVYEFPAFTFFSTGAVDVHTRTGTDTTIDLYWGLEQAIWTSGKAITLRNARGDIQSTFQIP